jgi:hypothetical protein
MKFAIHFAPLIGALLAPVAFAQSAAPARSAPQVPDISRILSQTFSEQDIEALAGTMRDAMQGKPSDPVRLQPLVKKMESLSALLLRELLAFGLPAIDKIETELKRELQNQKSGQ